MVSIYAKNKKDELSPLEIKALRQIVEDEEVR